MASMTATIETRGEIAAKSISSLPDEQLPITYLRTSAQATQPKLKVARGIDGTSGGRVIKDILQKTNNTKEFRQLGSKSGHFGPAMCQTVEYLATSQNYGRTSSSKSDFMTNQTESCISCNGSGPNSANQHSSASSADWQPIQQARLSTTATNATNTLTTTIGTTSMSNPSSYQLQYQEEFNKVRERLFRLLSKVPIHVETEPQEQSGLDSTNEPAKSAQLKSLIASTSSSSLSPSCSSNSVSTPSSRQPNPGQKPFSSGPLIVKYYNQRSLADVLEFHFGCSLMKHNFEQGLRFKWPEQHQQHQSGNQQTIMPSNETSVASLSGFEMQTVGQYGNDTTQQGGDQNLHSSSPCRQPEPVGNNHQSSICSNADRSWVQPEVAHAWQHQPHTRQQDQLHQGAYSRSYNSKYHLSNGSGRPPSITKAVNCENQHQPSNNIEKKRSPKTGRLQQLTSSITISGRPQPYPSDYHRPNSATGGSNSSSPLESCGASTNSHRELPYSPMKNPYVPSSDAIVISSDIMGLQQHQLQQQPQYMDVHLYTSGSPQLIQCYPSESNGDLANAGQVLTGNQMLVDEPCFVLERQHQHHLNSCQPYQIDDPTAYYAGQQQQVQVQVSSSWQICTPTQQQQIDIEDHHQQQQQQHQLNMQPAPNYVQVPADHANLYLAQTGSSHPSGSCQSAGEHAFTTQPYGATTIAESQPSGAFAMFAPQ